VKAYPKIARRGGLLVAAGLLMLAGAAAAVHAQSETTVVMAEFMFDPDGMTLPEGPTTLTLQNDGQFPHNLHIEGNDISLDVKTDGPVAGGDSFTSEVSLPAGIYDVWCPVGSHRDRGMVGTLTVGDAVAASRVVAQMR
jgi:plastocyanin